MNEATRPGNGGAVPESRPRGNPYIERLEQLLPLVKAAELERERRIAELEEKVERLERVLAAHGLQNDPKCCF